MSWDIDDWSEGLIVNLAKKAYMLICPKDK